MSLNLSSLQSALKSLDEAFIEYEKMPESTLMRDGIIQRFEYSFELCWKMLQRELRQEVGEELVDTAKNYSKKDLFRLAWERKLILHSQTWFDYLEARNLTSHSYNEAKAELVFNAIKPFLNDATYLLAQLEERNA